MQRPFEDIGVDQIMLIMQTETIDHEQVMGSIELYGKEVIRRLRTPKSSSSILGLNRSALRSTRGVRFPNSEVASCHAR